MRPDAARRAAGRGTNQLAVKRPTLFLAKGLLRPNHLSHISNRRLNQRQMGVTYAFEDRQSPHPHSRIVAGHIPQSTPHECASVAVNSTKCGQQSLPPHGFRQDSVLQARKFLFFLARIFHVPARRWRK